MRSTVTAVLVASQGGQWLDETIAGIAAQTRRPNAIVAVNNGGTERVGAQLVRANLGSAEAARVIGVQHKVSFGRAVAAGLSAMAPGSQPEDEWIWLLTEDSCPEPEALERILASVERAQSVVVAGPKLVDWDHPERIIELGQSLTGGGSRWLLRRQELDQQQYDHLEDVLGVGPVGMLVRRDVWDELGGFDPAYPTYDDGLDFCVRTRLAGYRVEVAPASRVRFARSGVAGPHIDRSRKVLRAAHRQARVAHLHRRIAYAPPVIAFFMWLLLPLLAFGRVAWSLIREQPGNMVGEFLAAFQVFLRPHALVASRKRVRRSSKVGWAAIRPLRTDRKTVRTARMIDREAILAAQGRMPREMHFISSGGLAVLVLTTVAAIALTWWALTSTSLIGGGLAPLSDIGTLWRNTRTLDGVPADPFTWVLAVLGSITFWNPSHAIVIFMIIAVPLSALGAWIWAAQITESAAARALVSIGFALSPVMLGSIASGHLTTLILAVVMPWLLLAGARARESWSWAGTASLLTAVALACAPVLIPAAIVVLIIGALSSVRGSLRVLSIAIAPLALFAPKLLAAIENGTLLNLLQDPGISFPYEPGTVWHMLLGFPEFGLDGWGRLFEQIGLGGIPATLLVGVLMLPIALLAVLGVYTGRIAVTVLNALLGGLGIVTAIGATRLMLTTSGDASVAVWAGSGLVVYWLALLSLAAVGAETARRAAPAVVAVALIAAVGAVGPIAVRLATGNVPFAAGTSQMPAIVQVAGEQQPNTRTLVITALGERSVRAEFVTGTGGTLDEIRTATNTGGASEADTDLAHLVGTLASIGGGDVAGALSEQHVNFVLLRSGNDPEAETELQRTLDQHTELAGVGVTKQGLLWRVSNSVTKTEPVGDEATALHGTTWGGNTVWTVQLILLGAMFLLALPTGEVVERPERRERPKRLKREKAARGAKKGGKPAPAATQAVQSIPGESIAAEPEVASEVAPEAAVETGAQAAPSTDEAPGTDEVPGTDEAPGTHEVNGTEDAPNSATSEGDER